MRDAGREQTGAVCFEPIRASGPVGIGVHVLRQTAGAPGATVADVWLTVLFLPLVPLGRWMLEADHGSASAWRVRQVGAPRLVSSVLGVAGGVLAALATLVPGWLAVTFFMGSKPAELAGLFSSAGAIVGILGWLDQTRDRVPLGTVARVVAARRTPGMDGGA